MGSSVEYIFFKPQGSYDVLIMNSDNSTDSWASKDLNSAWTGIGTGIQKWILYYSATLKASILVV